MKQTTVATMKALVIDDYGPPQNSRIRQVEIPTPKDDELLVRIHAAAVNPYDYKIISGAVKEWVPITFPYVPGMDGAGVVADVGTKVQGWRKGDAVLAQFPAGAFAEFAVISGMDKKLARKPDALDFEHAAALPEAGLMAKTLIRAVGALEGKTVLVVGASGGIGLYATQLANSEGAKVIATGTTSDVDYLRQLGAADVIDYKSGDTFEQTKRRYPDGVDVIIDVIDSGEAILRDAQVLRAGGIIASSLGGPPQDAFPAGATVLYLELTAEQGDLEDLAHSAADGRLRVEIGSTYDLSQAAQALADLVDPAKHTRGKLVVRVP